MRLALGIIHGTIGWVLMGMSKFLPGVLRRALERHAFLAACRMYALGGGIDDGAFALVESWGIEKRRELKMLVEAGRIPQKLRFYAHLLTMQV